MLERWKCWQRVSSGEVFPAKFNYHGPDPDIRWVRTWKRLFTCKDVLLFRLKNSEFKKLLCYFFLGCEHYWADYNHIYEYRIWYSAGIPLYKKNPWNSSFCGAWNSGYPARPKSLRMKFSWKQAHYCLLNWLK